MPTMWLSDAQKVGVAFCSGGGFFLLGGVIMFFDRAMLAMGNILFIIGLTLIIGLQKTLLFFARRQKLKVELYGIFVLFGDFFATIGGFVGSVPVVGPYIKHILDRMGGGRRNAELPV
ncbi:MAG: Got1-like family [Lasallia pustulata]|uniref:Got1-like family n=1 Tax=Lasallia pustulata TaxID=136370 RepID=A0A5M8PTG9_9LECA|nr:MAG: Got1-like family [Lasallia pustulata]